jgi:hypothetical protein
VAQPLGVAQVDVERADVRHRRAHGAVGTSGTRSPLTGHLRRPAPVEGSSPTAQSPPASSPRKNMPWRSVSRDRSHFPKWPSRTAPDDCRQTRSGTSLLHSAQVGSRENSTVDSISCCLRSSGWGKSSLDCGQPDVTDISKRIKIRSGWQYS